MDFSKHIQQYLEDNGYSEMNITTALVDMDGVLYDSMKKHTAAWFRLMTELGVECERDEFYLYEGMTGIGTINLLFKREFNREVSKEESQELYAKKAKYFVELGEPEMMQDADKMLSILQHEGITPVLVTGSGQHSVLDRISHDYPNVFDENHRITAHNVKHGKPNPEPYIRGMEIVGAKPNQCIVIENAPLGVEAGHKAGCFTIAITTGPIPAKELWDSGANLVFNSMNEFASQLPSLLNCFKHI